MSATGRASQGCRCPGPSHANLPCDDRPSDDAFVHVVFGRNATILRPLKDPLGMPTEDVLILLESRILGLSVDHLQYFVLNPFCLIVIAGVSITSNIAEGSKRPDGCVTKVLKYSAGGIATRRARPIRVIVDPLPLA